MTRPGAKVGRKGNRARTGFTIPELSPVQQKVAQPGPGLGGLQAGPMRC